MVDSGAWECLAETCVCRVCYALLGDSCPPRRGGNVNVAKAGRGDAVLVHSQRRAAQPNTTRSTHTGLAVPNNAFLVWPSVRTAKPSSDMASFRRQQKVQSPSTLSDRACRTVCRIRSPRARGTVTVSELLDAKARCRKGFLGGRVKFVCFCFSPHSTHSGAACYSTKRHLIASLLGPRSPESCCVAGCKLSISSMLQTSDED